MKEKIEQSATPTIEVGGFNQALTEALFYDSHDGLITPENLKNSLIRVMSKQTGFDYDQVSSIASGILSCLDRHGLNSLHEQMNQSTHDERHEIASKQIDLFLEAAKQFAQTKLRAEQKDSFKSIIV